MAVLFAVFSTCYLKPIITLFYTINFKLLSDAVEIVFVVIEGYQLRYDKEETIRNNEKRAA